MSKNYFSHDTIAAIATSLAGSGGIGVIRLSGPESLHIAQKLCPSFVHFKPRTLKRVFVIDPKNQSILDDGLAVYFSEDNSFTGEKIVELQLHGGRLLLQVILKLALETGLCRLALPGEFSFRAVRNGKMSLPDAESMNQVIHAKSLFEIEVVRNNLNKSRLKDFDEIKAKIQSLLVHSELSIDFIDQDVEVVSLQKMKDEISWIEKKLSNLLIQVQASVRLANGLLITLSGVPNAGKSTLFNTILSEERSIVSALPGTTRDVVTEEFHLDQFRIRLADTAGIRDADGEIERQGIDRAKNLISEAEINLLVIDSSLQKEQIFHECNAVFSEKTILVLNKADKASISYMELGEYLKSKNLNFLDYVFVSALNGIGIESLFKAIKNALNLKNLENNQFFLPSEFQLQMILECKAAMEQASKLIEQTGLQNPELISANFHCALKAIGDLAGETTAEDILSKIFNEFCIGK